MLQRIAMAAVLYSASLAPAAEQVVGGPFVVNVGPRKATVAWVVRTAEGKLGAAPGRLDKSAPVLRGEKITYAGLEPGKTYYYEIPGWTGQGHFKTPPAGRASFQFVVYGDTRSRHDVHQRVVDAIAKTNPDFVVHTGDLVLDGGQSDLWPVFFNIEKDLLSKTVFFPSLGNHERNSRHYYEFFDVGTPYYSVDWGTTHLTVLNSDLGNVALSRVAKEAFWAEQKSWLEADLARAQQADLRLVAMHHPPFTAMKRRQGDNKEVAELIPLFEKYKVNAVFGGHDHNYQRHLNNGIQYIVTGGGGAPLYPLDAPIAGITQKLESVEHFVTVKVEGAKATLEAIKLDGTVIEQVTIP